MLSWSHNETSKGGQHSEKIRFFRDRLFHQAANACSEVVAELGPLPLPETEEEHHQEHHRET